MENITLIGDIGGTNARFAFAGGNNGFYHDMDLKCADFLDSTQAIRHYLDTIGAQDPVNICLAVAGRIEKQEVRLTNNYWHIVAETLSAQFSGANVRLINDFTAIAHAIPVLKPDDSVTIGAPSPVQVNTNNFRVGIIGPGTGLGVAGLIKRRGRLTPITSEAGHIGFAPETQMQIDLLVTLRDRYPRVSTERLLSGSGLENIYWALSRLHNQAYTPFRAAEIFQEAVKQPDSLAGETVQLFFEILGQAAGDLALMLGAEDGIYITGGISKRYPQLLAASRFRAAFENKGRYRAYMESIPTQLIVHSHPGLLGASAHMQSPEN